MSFFKNNWIYIAIAFSIVFLLGIGYITYSRLSQLDQTTQPSDQSDEPVSEVEVTFQITPQAPTPVASECLELVATPLSGPAPLTVSFTGLASDPSSTLVFDFDFGDSTSESVTFSGSPSPDGLVAQLMSHTYTEDGTYTAVLSVETPTTVLTSTSCSIDIIVGDTDAIALNTAPNITQTPTHAPSVAPTIAPSIAPTSTPIPLSTPSPTSALTSPTSPTPTVAVAVPDVPQAGNYLPTVLAISGAILILFLAFAVL